MGYMWSTARRDSPLWTGLFLVLAVLLLQPAGAQEPSQKEVVKNMVADADNYLEKGCPVWSEKPVILKQLEQKMSEVRFQEDNFTVICPNIQALVFNIQPRNFAGRTISSMSTQDGKNSSLLNNDILGATFENFSVTNLSEPVEIRFWHEETLDNSNATCVFWVEGTEDASLGKWSSAGCNTTHEDKVVLCRCKHLTYFAVLLQISSAAIDEAILAPLTYISMVGCSLSAGASLLTVLHYLASRKKSRDDTTKIHMNLLGALFLLNVSFLLSEPLAAVRSPRLCKGAAVSLHYALLCCLTWMAIEGFHLYLLLIKVYNVYIRRYILKLCAVGWGLPAFAVVSVLLIKDKPYGLYIIKTDTGYDNATMCWITDRALDVHYILNLGYAGLTVLFNTVILVTVTSMLRKLRSDTKSQRERVKKDLVTVLGLTCLLGTTWALAFLSFGVFLIPQLILFTVINSLLGFFICLWYCTIRRQPDASLSTGSSQTTK